MSDGRRDGTSGEGGPGGAGAGAGAPAGPGAGGGDGAGRGRTGRPKGGIAAGGAALRYVFRMFAFLGALLTLAVVLHAWMADGGYRLVAVAPSYLFLAMCILAVVLAHALLVAAPYWALHEGYVTLGKLRAAPAARARTPAAEDDDDARPSEEAARVLCMLSGFAVTVMLFPTAMSALVHVLYAMAEGLFTVAPAQIEALFRRGTSCVERHVGPPLDPGGAPLSGDAAMEAASAIVNNDSAREMMRDCVPGMLDDARRGIAAAFQNVAAQPGAAEVSAVDVVLALVVVSMVSLGVSRFTTTPNRVARLWISFAGIAFFSVYLALSATLAVAVLQEKSPVARELTGESLQRRLSEILAQAVSAADLRDYDEARRGESAAQGEEDARRVVDHLLARLGEGEGAAPGAEAAGQGGAPAGAPPPAPAPEPGGGAGARDAAPPPSPAPAAAPATAPTVSKSASAKSVDGGGGGYKRADEDMPLGNAGRAMTPVSPGGARDLARRQSVQFQLEMLEWEADERRAFIRDAMIGRLDGAETASLAAVISATVAQYEADRSESGRELAQHFRNMVSWFRRTVQAARTAQLACLSVARGARNLRERLRLLSGAGDDDARVLALLEEHDRWRSSIQTQWRECAENRGFGDPPFRPVFGQHLGPAGKMAGWLLSAHSQPLTLVTGLVGYGLLGALAARFVRRVTVAGLERREAKPGGGAPGAAGIAAGAAGAATAAAPRPSSPFAKGEPPELGEMAEVVFIGFAAAMIVYLAAYGGLAIFSSGAGAGEGAQPNAYAVFATCLAGAAYHPEIWRKARKWFSKEDPPAGGEG